jgi:hypothetical protein
MSPKTQCCHDTCAGGHDKNQIDFYQFHKSKRALCERFRRRTKVFAGLST